MCFFGNCKAYRERESQQSRSGGEKKQRETVSDSQEPGVMGVCESDGKSQLLVRVACDLFDTPLEMPHIPLECMCT